MKITKFNPSHFSLALILCLSSCGDKDGANDPSDPSSPNNQATLEQLPEASDLVTNCKLDKAIDISNKENIKTHFIEFKNVKLDQALPNPGAITANVGLKLSIFPIHKIPYTGARIEGEDGKGFGEGFAHIYSGNYSFSGGTKIRNSLTYVNTVDESASKDPSHKEAARRELEMVLIDNSIQSIRLTVPVYNSGSGISMYSGENKALCIRSAEFVKSSPVIP